MAKTKKVNNNFNVKTGSHRQWKESNKKNLTVAKSNLHKGNQFKNKHKHFKKPDILKTSSLLTNNENGDNSSKPSSSSNYYFKKMSHLSLRERMQAKLKAAKFRYLNEQLYTSSGNQMENVFREFGGSYDDYHEGFKQQVKRWPINPLDIIIKSLKKKATGSLVVADFGCGEAKLEESLQGLANVHSIDLVASKPNVIQCDMANTPLESNTVDVAVFCLSLMSSNLSGYIAEGNRVLKEGGLLKIAEVESRFDNVENFIKSIESFGFKCLSTNLSHKLFYFMSFKKMQDIGKKKKNNLPGLSLKPCLYKKR